MLVAFEHAGITSGNLNRTIAFYCDLLGLRLVLRKPTGKGELAFLEAPGGMLEIFAPAAPVAPARDVPTTEGGVRHLTFAVDAVDPLVETLRAASVTIAEEPRDAHNRELIRRVAFCRDPDGQLIELIERAEGR